MIFLEQSSGGGVSLEMSLLDVFSDFRLRQLVAIFQSKKAVFLVQMEKAQILYCSLEYSAQGDKW